MANTIVTPTWVSKDTAMSWKNNVRLIGQADRGYGDVWQNLPEGAKIGYTVQQRIPWRPIVSEGQALQIQPIVNQTVPISLTHQLQVAIGWSTADDTVLIEEVQERYTKPTGKALASKCDALFGQEVYRAVNMTVGTPGLAVTGNDTIMDGIAKMANQAVPTEDLVAVLDPRAMSKLVTANFALFNLPGGSQNFRTGQFSGEQFGVGKWFMDPLMPTHTTGSFTTATPIVSGALQSGSTILMAGMGTYAMKAGDTFKIAGVNALNPVAFTDSGDLMEFTLVADLAGTTTGTFTFSPPIILGPSSLATVTALPANGAAVTWTGATGTVSATMTATISRQSLIFNPSAFAFVNAPLARKLAGAETGQIRDAQARISMRYVEQYQIGTDFEPRRIDMLVGNAAVLPWFALRMWS